MDCIQVINNKIEEQTLSIPNVSERSYLEAMKNILINNIHLDELNEEQKFFIKEKILDQIRRSQSRCSYCGKVIPRGKYICDWCDHRRDDEDAGFFPYPYIFKPPDGGGGSPRRPIAVPVKIRTQS